MKYFCSYIGEVFIGTGRVCMPVELWNSGMTG